MKDSLSALARFVRSNYDSIDDRINSLPNTSFDDVQFNYLAGKLYAYRVVLKMINDLVND